MAPQWLAVGGSAGTALMFMLLWGLGFRQKRFLQKRCEHLQQQLKVRDELANQARTGWVALNQDLDIQSVSTSLNNLFDDPKAAVGSHVSALVLPWPLAALRAWRDGKSTFFEQQVPDYQLWGYRRDGLLWVQITCQRGLQQQLRTLRQQLQKDGLTGLLNRQGFILRLAAEGLGGALLVQFNLSRFRLLNDNLGLDAGDNLLRRLGELVEGALRHGEFAARPDGDTFWLRLDGSKPWQERLEGLIKVLDEALDQSIPQGFPLAVKAGVCEAEEGMDLWEGLRRADFACHLASDQPWVRFSADHPVLVQRLQASKWAKAVTHAINTDNFLLFYQPLESLKPQHGQLRAEVLVRMLGDDGEMLSPGRFLAATEDFRLTSRLDRWVIKAVIDWLGKHPQLHDHLVLAVNLSGQSLSDSRFALAIRQWLAEAAVPAKTLCIEITESVAIDNLKEARRFMRALQEVGVRFALDDFGSGFSSFKYLQALPVDYVKIDGSLIQDLLRSRRDRAIVRGIASVCRGLSLPVVAEFVDKPELLEFVRRLGLDYAQGNLIGRPSRLDLLPLEWQEQQDEVVG